MLDGLHSEFRRVTGQPRIFSGRHAIWNHVISQANPGGGSTDRPNFLKNLRATIADIPYTSAIEREPELAKIVNILGRPDKNSVVLVGPPGVGKSSLMYELARRITRGDFPQFANRELLLLDIPALTTGLGPIEEKIIKLKAYLSSSPNKAIIFVDEIQRLFTLQGVAGRVLDSLKEDLATDRLTLFGTTTKKDFLKSTQADSALQRRTNIVDVEEMSEGSSIVALSSICPSFEKDFSAKAEKQVIIPEALFALAVKLAAEYLKNKAFPDKALDVIKQACSMRVMALQNAKGELLALQNKIRVEVNMALRVLRDQDDKGIVGSKKSLVDLCAQYAALQSKIKELAAKKEIKISKDDIYASISELAKVPAAKLKEDEASKLQRLEQLLGERVIGQDEAKSRIASTVRQSRILRRPGKPQGVFFFAGPTGCGKTEIAKALAEALGGDEKGLVRIDMAEYAEPHSVARLIGSPPGYVGYDEGGQLTKAIADRPNSIILLDEFEKSNPAVWQVFLNIFDDGRLTDGKGKTTDFSSTIIIMTSNLAALHIREATRDLEPEEKRKSAHRIFEAALREAFSPEFIARINDILFFDALNPDQLRQVFDIQIKKLSAQISDKGYEIQVDDSAKDLIIEKGYSDEFGARPLSNTLNRLLINPMVNLIIAETFPERSVISATRNGDELAFEKTGDIPRPTFDIPNIGGHVGLLVLRLLSFVDLQAGQSKTQVPQDEIDGVLMPNDEKIMEALNKVVAEGLLPTGRETLRMQDPKKKDPAVAAWAEKVSQLSNTAGYNFKVQETVSDFIFFMSSHARTASLESGTDLLPVLTWNFNGEALTLSFTMPIIPQKSKLREKIEKNFVKAEPASKDEAQTIFESLGELGDSTFLELKRKAKEANVQVGMDDSNGSTVMYLRVKLFADTKNPSPPEPSPAAAYLYAPHPLYANLRNDAHLTDAEEISLVEHINKDPSRAWYLNDLVKIIDSDEIGFSIKIYAAAIFAALIGAKDAVPQIKKLLRMFPIDGNFPRFIGRMVIAREARTEFGKAVIIAIFSMINEVPEMFKGALYACRDSKLFGLILNLFSDGADVFPTFAYDALEAAAENIISENEPLPLKRLILWAYAVPAKTARMELIKKRIKDKLDYNFLTLDTLKELAASQGYWKGDNAPINLMPFVINGTKITGDNLLAEPKRSSIRKKLSDPISDFRRYIQLFSYIIDARGTLHFAYTLNDIERAFSYIETLAKEIENEIDKRDCERETQALLDKMVDHLKIASEIPAETYINLFNILLDVKIKLLGPERAGKKFADLMAMLKAIQYKPSLITEVGNELMDSLRFRRDLAVRQAKQ
ncbi:ATP-dependent Clp protease ATP-binding subunit [Candidatus Saganbacteria bacterium]|nr:ATP-dependent Clp protease ATP-binding subunit [Candidatus Saganbacteria bacterium]